MSFRRYPSPAGSALPSGASTSVLQTAGNVSVASIDIKTPALGQALAAASAPVVLTAAQITTLTPLASVAISNLPAVQTIQPLAAIVATGSVTSAVALFTQDCASYQSVSVHITAIPAGNVVSFQISNDNVNWYNCACMPGGDLISILATTAAVAGPYSSQLNSRYFRAIVSTYTSGTIAATAYFKNFGNSPNSVGGYVSALQLDGSGNGITSTAGAMNVSLVGGATSALQSPLNVSAASIDTKTPILGQALATGSVPVVLTAAQIATLTPLASVSVSNFPALPSSNITQIGGTAITLGQKTSAASLPVTLASDYVALSPKGRGVLTPFRNAYGSVNVLTGSYTQVTAVTSAQINEIEIFDSSGQTMAIAIGAAAAEVVQAYIFPGGNGRMPLLIPAGSRISIIAISASATLGEIDINFYT